MEESVKLQISQSGACLLGKRAELERLVLCESFDFCSPSWEAATVLRPCWVALVNEGLWEGLTIRNTNRRWLAGSFFFSSSPVGSCEEDHNTCHGECGNHSPQTRKSRLALLSESQLLGLGWTMNQTVSLDICGDLGCGPWPLSFPEYWFPGKREALQPWL